MDESSSSSESDDEDAMQLMLRARSIAITLVGGRDVWDKMSSERRNEIMNEAKAKAITMG